MYAYVNPSMHNFVYTLCDIQIEIECAHWNNVYLIILIGVHGLTSNLVCNVSICVVM